MWTECAFKTVNWQLIGGRDAQRAIDRDLPSRLIATLWTAVDTRESAKLAYFMRSTLLCQHPYDSILSHLLSSESMPRPNRRASGTVMDLRYILLTLACTSIALSRALVNSTSDNSFATTLSSNQTLNAWPPSLPWTMNLGDGLSMEVFWYGQDAPLSRWTEIAKNLDETLRDIDNKPGDPERIFGPLAFEYDHHFLMYFFGSIRKWEASRVVQAIRDLYFVSQDHPRELEFLLQTQNPPRRFYCRLVWSPVDPSRRSHWPASLPWNLRVPFEYPPSTPYQLFLQFYHYAKTPITPSDRTLRDSLDGLIVELNQEGPRDGIVSKGSYAHTILEVRVQKSLESGRVEITRAEMLSIVETMRELYLTPYHWDLTEVGFRVVHWDSLAPSTQHQRSLGFLQFLFRGHASAFLRGK